MEPLVSFLGLFVVRWAVATTPAAYQYEAYIASIFVSKSELPINLEVVKPAVMIAEEDANRRYPHIRFHTIFRNSSNSCTANLAGVFAAEEYYRRKVTAFVGPACSLALDPVARMASYWNLPIYTAGGIDVAFSKKEVFSTLTRLSFSLDRVADFVLTVLKEYDWQHVVVITDETELQEILLKKSIVEALKSTKSYELMMNYKDFSRRQDEQPNYRKIMEDCSRLARVFILITGGETLRTLLLHGYDLGMNNGEYTFLSFELVKNRQSYGDFSWYLEVDKRNKEAREMYESLMVFSVRIPTSDRYKRFVHRVTAMATAEFGTADEASVNPIVAGFYDAVQMYAWNLNSTLAAGLDPEDGHAMVRRVWNTTFPGGLTGDITINENGDRENDYSLNDLDPDTGMMRPVATYKGEGNSEPVATYYGARNSEPVSTFYGAKRKYERIRDSEIHWPAGRKEPPPDIPYCGFTGDADHCIQKEPFSLTGAIGIVVTILAAMAGVIGFILNRKLKLESQLANLWWKVHWDDILFPEKLTKKSAVSLPLSDDGVSFKSKPSASAISTLQGITLSGFVVGMYKGQKVAVKPLDVLKLHMPRSLLLELKDMRDLTHENLVRFIGLCPDEPNVSVLTDLCTRGSLRDMLENDAMKIDWVFRYSMLTDIIEGINYLHNSIIQYHGRLKSTCCYIDGRFMVKLSDYGLRALYEQVAAEESRNLRSLFWMAPEHLRKPRPELEGSKKGDVYSFAIILQEVITRCGPFESLERLGRNRAIMEPEEILDRIKMGTVPPFRPEVASDECSEELLNLMHLCWHEIPEVRPSMIEIKIQMRKISKGISNKNFLDNLLNRMEQYSNNLESLVEEKTQSLLEEKKKTDDILYQLLPKYIADELKEGRHVKPEAYDSVTIFFSDIVGFTQLSAESTPFQVVDFLNELYTCFDAIIEKYNCYKVETIGDAYLVVSGLPVRNGHEHVREIARLALGLVRALDKFKIKHKPDRKLKIRIGIHSGPCCAGVVGLKMPRYCLFGDTVNTASRMESTGEALKIHISPQSKALLELFGTFTIVPRGDIEIKGKGVMKTYWLIGENKLGE